MMNNDIKNQQRELKEIYDLCCDCLEIFIKDPKNKKSQLNLENQMDRLFFEVERCAADSHSLYDTELHDTGKWFADTSQDALKALVCYQQLMKKIKKENYYSPSEKALSSMQSLVKIYLDKKQTLELKELLSNNSITTYGFDEKRKFRMTKTNERIFSIIAATISIIIMLVLIFNLDVDDSSRIKYTILSVLISILGGISANLLSGVLNLKIKDTTATAGFGIAVIIFCILQGVRIF